ncbi:MAG: DNA adenine methylase [Micrococcales bacterium]
MIKYLGSKRTLVPVLSALAEASQAKTAVDLFTGTTRVAQGFKKAGLEVTATDLASYSFVFSKTWIETDANEVSKVELQQALKHLNSLSGEAGYFTKAFCEDARYIQPKNGERIDAIRVEIERTYRDSWLYYPLLTSLILAADRVDSTTGLQMAFLKKWASRSFNDLELRDPDLLPGTGKALQGDVMQLVNELPETELAYLDPPYNQHRYFANYHVWETLVRWDEPQTYGIANKRLDVRDASTKSRFNGRKDMPLALTELLNNLKAQTVMLSYNNEAWLSREQLIALTERFGRVEVLDFEFKRYIGSQIGIYNKKGVKVSEPRHKQNIEHVVIAGETNRVAAMLEAIALN